MSKLLAPRVARRWLSSEPFDDIFLHSRRLTFEHMRTLRVPMVRNFLGLRYLSFAWTDVFFCHARCIYQFVHESQFWLVHPFWQTCSVNFFGVVLLRHRPIIDNLSLRRRLVFLEIGVVPSFVQVGRTKAAATFAAWPHHGHVRPEWVVFLRGMRDALQQT